MNLLKKSDVFSSIDIVSDLSFTSSLQYKFTLGYGKDTVVASYKISTHDSVMNTAEKMRALLPSGVNMTIMGGGLISLICLLERSEEFIGYFIISDSSADMEYENVEGSPYIMKHGKFLLNFVMDKLVFEDIRKAVEGVWPTEKKSNLKWFFIKDGRAASKDIPLTDNNIIDNSYYPFVSGGVDKLVHDYIESKESILLLLGPPGTGKTSLVRNLIVNNNFNASMTYDEAIFTSDKFYIDYLMDEETDLLIVEDADILLEDRADAGNKVMGKILNVGDGLVKMPNKKMIFTTNISDVRKIDPAIMRPGRCFAVVNFRNLTQDEADIACVKADLEPISGKKEYSLADIFSRKENQITVRKFGFI